MRYQGIFVNMYVLYFSRYFSFISRLGRKWHLSGFALIVLLKNHSNIFLDAHSSFFKTLFGNFLCLYRVLSSASLVTSTLSITTNKSHKNILNNTGSKTNPCGTPYLISFQKLWLLFIFTHGKSTDKRSLTYFKSILKIWHL